MKKIRFVAFFTCLAVWVGILSVPAAAQVLYPYPESEGNRVESASAMLVYLGVTSADDVVLYEKEADIPYSPGALVRVMVGAYAMKAIEEQALDLDAVQGTYTLEMFNTTIAGTGLGNCNMAFGETWTLRDLLTASMVTTAADAALTMAVAISGSEAAFVSGMNELAAELGCTGSHFTNVTGLHDPDQYMTARDTVAITRYAADYPALRNMMELSQYTVTPVSNGSTRSWPASNELLRSVSPYYDADVAYGRTGFADDRYAVVAMGSKAGYEYMAVALGAPKTGDNGEAGVHYRDVSRLLDWGFKDFAYKTLLQKNEPVGRIDVDLSWNTDSVALVPATDFSTIVASGVDASQIIRVVTKNQETLTAPVEKDQVLGKVELYLNIDQKIGEVELVAAESVERSDLLAAWEKFRQFLGSPWFYAGILLIGLLLLGYVVLNIVHNRNRRRQGRKKVRRFK